MNLSDNIKHVVSEIFQPAQKDGLADKNGQRIVTNRLVKLGEKRGQIKGVTVNAKVKVFWLFPEKVAKTTSAEDPKSLEVY